MTVGHRALFSPPPVSNYPGFAAQEIARRRIQVVCQKAPGTRFCEEGIACGDLRRIAARSITLARHLDRRQEHESHHREFRDLCGQRLQDITGIISFTFPRRRARIARFGVPARVHTQRGPSDRLGSTPSHRKRGTVDFEESTVDTY